MIGQVQGENSTLHRYCFKEFYEIFLSFHIISSFRWSITFFHVVEKLKNFEKFRQKKLLVNLISFTTIQDLGIEEYNILWFKNYGTFQVIVKIYSNYIISFSV